MQIKAFALVLLGCSGAVLAQAAAPGDDPVQPLPTSDSDRPAARGSHFGLGAADWSVSGLGTWQTSADLDSGGDVSVFRAQGNVSMKAPMSPRWQLNGDISHEYSNYDFDSGSGIFTPTGGGQLFEELHRTSISLSASVAHDERWSWTVGGRVEFAAEGEAVYNDAFTFSALGGAMYTLRPGVRVGMGLLVSTRLEEDTVVWPVPLIDATWKVSDRAALTAGTREGVRFAYEIEQDVTFSASVGWRYAEYRLDDTGGAPNGVFSEFQVPLAVDVLWNPAAGLDLKAGVGVNVYNELQVDDFAGNTLLDTDADPALFLRAGLTYRF